MTAARPDASVETRDGRQPTEERLLYEVISVVGSSSDLEDVLAAVVRLLSDASAVHACFVYLLDLEGRRLVLRAASGPYSTLIGQIELRRGEGLAWWVLNQREAAFIRENALEDARVKYVPELEEERFQSLVAVPLLGRRGSRIGVMTLNTEAPREFTDAEVELFVSSASLVAGAIENASLFDETGRRVSELQQLTEFAEAVAAAETLDELGEEVVIGCRDLLGAEAVCIYLIDGAEERLQLRFLSPIGVDVARTIGLSELGSDLGRSRKPRTSVPLIAGSELLGALVAHGTRERGLAGAVANQTAVAIKKIEVLEHLTEKNLIRDFFDDLSSGRAGAGLEARALRLGCDLDRAHFALAAHHVDPGLARALCSPPFRALVDYRECNLRALVPVPAGGPAVLVEQLRRQSAESGASVRLGVSSPCIGRDALAQGFEEAQHALLGTALIQGAASLLAYEELGAYKYLLRIALDANARDSTIDALSRLAEYDRERGSSLLPTLEEYLRRRGNISATSEALFVHPNTLRQRLRRIGDLSAIDLRRDDWLMIEIAVKLVRLRTTLEATASTYPRGELWRNWLSFAPRPGDT